jgi:hypothetical protein
MIQSHNGELDLVEHAARLYEKLVSSLVAIPLYYDSELGFIPDYRGAVGEYLMYRGGNDPEDGFKANKVMARGHAWEAICWEPGLARHFKRPTFDQFYELITSQRNMQRARTLAEIKTRIEKGA